MPAAGVDDGELDLLVERRSRTRTSSVANDHPAHQVGLVDR